MAENYRLGLAACIAVLVLGGCGKAEMLQKPDGPAYMLAAKEDAPPPADQGIKISLPQIAYTYTYSFTLPRAHIFDVRKAHLAECEKLGPKRCQVVNMGSTESEYGVDASLTLKIDASIARQFGANLNRTVNNSGGEQASESINAEDLSKQIIDTDARVKAKELLAKRLSELLATRSGSVADLIAAERALSDVLEELDSARTLLAALRGRVAMSDMTINYSARPTTSGSLFAPVKGAIESAGATLGASLGSLISFIFTAAPWLLALWGAVKLYKRMGGHWPRLRWPWKRND